MMLVVALISFVCTDGLSLSGVLDILPRAKLSHPVVFWRCVIVMSFLVKFNVFVVSWLL